MGLDAFLKLQLRVTRVPLPFICLSYYESILHDGVIINYGDLCCRNMKAYIFTYG